MTAAVIRSRLCLTPMLILALALASASAPAAAAVRAVFVAIDQYDHSRQHDPLAKPPFNDLQSTGPNLVIIKAKLAKALGVALDPGPRIASADCEDRGAVSITLTNHCATRTAILSSLKGEIGKARRGDTVLFYFAGLGSSAGGEPTIVPSDSRAPGRPPTDIERWELLTLAERANERGVNMTVVIDACQPGINGGWSGGVRAAPALARAAGKMPVIAIKAGQGRGQSLGLTLQCTGSMLDNGSITGTFGEMIYSHAPWLRLGLAPTGGPPLAPPWLLPPAKGAPPLMVAFGVPVMGPDGYVVYTNLPVSAVVGGFPAKPGAAPWMVELAYLGKLRPGFADTAEVRHACGGALINSMWVLTAAHCLPTAADGSVDVDAVARTMTARLGGNALNALEPIAIDRAFAHPAFCDSTVHPSRCALTVNDVALLRLAKAAPQDQPDVVRAVALPNVTDPLEAGSAVQVMGWGAVSEHASEDHAMTASLRIGDMQVVAPDECALLNRRAGGGAGFNGPMPATIVCASVAGAKVDACQGDSGGPLVLQGFNPEVVGVVSSGLDCAVAPGLYTKVAAFRGWIDTVMAAVAYADPANAP
jgi:hypothetical protein